MKSSLFTKGFKILIVTLLLLAVLFNRSLAQKLMLATILIWMFMVIVRFLKPTVRKLIENWYADRQYRRNITPLVLSAPMPDEAISFSPVPIGAYPAAVVIAGIECRKNTPVLINFTHFFSPLCS